MTDKVWTFHVPSSARIAAAIIVVHAMIYTGRGAAAASSVKWTVSSPEKNLVAAQKKPWNFVRRVHMAFVYFAHPTQMWAIDDTAMRFWKNMPAKSKICC